MSTIQIKTSNVHSPRQLWKGFQLFSWPPSSKILALGGLASASVARPGEVNQDQEVSTILITTGRRNSRDLFSSRPVRASYSGMVSEVQHRLNLFTAGLPWHLRTTGNSACWHNEPNMHVHAHVVQYLHACLCNAVVRWGMLNMIT
jgi:hypothetical protein